MKKICWVTSEWFADVDIPIIPELLGNYKIHWIIVLYPNGRFKESYFDKFKTLKNLEIEFVKVKHRARHPRTMIDYFQLLLSLRRAGADINYIDMTPGSPYMILPYLLMPSNKTIFAAHDGSIKPIMGPLVKWFFKLGYGIHSRFVHMFSKSQAEEFNINYPGKYVTVIPLMPKYYRAASNCVKNNVVSFLSFGTMHEEKNIGLLIRAAEELYNEGVTDFKVSICGKAPANWDDLYGKWIVHQELFNLQLRMIENEEIPNLFSSHSFAVYPYKIMSQSGALKVAYAYSIPVITSNLPAFKEEVCDGINGYIFESNNIDSLKNALRRCISMTPDQYSSLVNSTKDYINTNYSAKAIKNMYLEMFEKVLNL